MRTEESLFFACEQDEANCTFGLNSRRKDGFGASKYCGNSKSVVYGSSTQIPRVEMGPEHDNLLRIVRTRNLTHNVSRRDSTTREFVLNVNFPSPGFAYLERARDEIALFRRHVQNDQISAMERQADRPGV